MDRMKEIGDTIAYAGEIMLESGSEIYRAEQTMERMARSLHIAEVDIFTLPSCIYLTLRDGDDSYTRVKRAYPKSCDLARISAINQLSRDMESGEISLDYCQKRLREIACQPRLARWKTALLMALACAVFAVMLKQGSLKDFLCTFFISWLAYFVLDRLNSRNLHILLKNIIITMLVTFLTVLCVRVGLGEHQDAIIVGNIMLMVPGVALTNAVRDTLNGDILSGTIRILEAVTIAIGITIGAGVVLYVAGMAGL